MDVDFREALLSRPVFVFFLTIGLGYLLGAIRIRGFWLGPRPGPDGDPLVLELEDRITVGLRVSRIDEAATAFGPEVRDSDLLEGALESCEALVAHKWVAGLTLGELSESAAAHNCHIIKHARSLVDLPLDPETQLQTGDRLQIVGMAELLHQFAGRIGPHGTESEEMDLITFAFGIAFGLILAGIAVQLRSVRLELGMAGGLLTSGILVGYLRERYPGLGGLPGPARQVLIELGSMLFVAGVGIGAGSSLAEVLLSVGPQLFLLGALVTASTFFLSYAFGRLVLRLNPALLLGAIAGSMTNTPAMGAVADEARSAVPSLGYVGTYGFSTILLTIAGVAMLL